MRDFNAAPVLNRPDWKTRVTGEAEFKWAFNPARIDFDFRGPRVEGFDYQAANVHAEGVYQPALLTFDASGAAYGATATTRASFRFATPERPLSYSLAGTFANLDVRRLPERLSVPELETRAAGRYTFEAVGRNWRGEGTLRESTVEGARFDEGAVFAVESRDRALSYSASGNVAWLNPRRFAVPLELEWLDDPRLEGSLTGSLKFEGSGRTTDDLVIRTDAALVDSTLAGARFPDAAVNFEMAQREIRAKFTGAFEELPGTLITER